MKPVLVNHLDDNIDLLNNAIKYDSNYLNPEDCDLGYLFEQEITASDLTNDQIKELKGRCIEFIKTLLIELIKRMPTHLNIIEKIKCFSPRVLLNPKRPKFTEFPLHFIPKNTSVSDIEVQYRNLLNVKLNEVFQDDIPDNAITFWKKVITLTNDAGDLLFRDLALFAFTAFSVPSSNA